jgi:hypothetical protein
MLKGITAGRVPSDALVCEVGGKEWQAIASVPPFADAIAGRAAADALARKASRRFDENAERTMVDLTPSHFEAPELRTFDDAAEHTVVDRSPLKSESGVEGSGLRRFDETTEHTVVDGRPPRQSEPPL